MANHKGPPASPDPIEDGLPGDDIELVGDDLRRMYHLEALAHAPSLARVYGRLQEIERSGTSLSPAEGTRLPIPPPIYPSKGTNAMRTSKTINTQASPPPRRLPPLAPSRLTRIAAVLATGLLLTGALFGFLYFHGQRAVSPAPTLTAMLRCHSATSLAIPYASPPEMSPPYPPRDQAQEVLDWSARGEIMYPVGQMGQTFTDANTCARVPVAFKPPVPPTPKDYPGVSSGRPFSAVWSPDGTRLLLLLEFVEPPYFDPPMVFDATTGQFLASLQMSSDSVISKLLPKIGQAVWSTDGTQIITLTGFGSIDALGVPKGGVSPYKVQVWDSRTGALLRTGIELRLNNIPFGAWLSPNGSYLAVRLPDRRIQFWDTATAKLLSTTPPLATVWRGTVAWSPDGSYFAFGISSASPSVTPAQVQIWSRATGQLVATLTDTDAYQGSSWGWPGLRVAGTWRRVVDRSMSGTQRPGSRLRPLAASRPARRTPPMLSPPWPGHQTAACWRP